MTKRWRSIETVLERARRALPVQDAGVIPDLDSALSDYGEYLSQNELELALNALVDAADLVPSRGGVWKDLIRAAKLMQLEDLLPELEKRFRASASSVQL